MSPSTTINKHVINPNSCYHKWNMRRL